MIEHVAKIAAVDPASTGRAFDQVLGLIPRWIANAPSNVFPAGDTDHGLRPSIFTALDRLDVVRPTSVPL
jgi:hypothetical protein